MKELTIEEKAQRYDEAYKRVAVRFGSNVADEIFLKDSEDEKIRKDIVEAVELHKDFTQKRKEYIYAWLEKQGKQKLTDKVEPKFKVGDWIVYNDNLYHIGNIALQRYYECLRVDGTVHTFSLDIDSKSHLWTIQDAKDGDVLACGNEIVIFKKNSYNPKDQSGCMFVYCAFNKRGYWYEIGGINPTFYKPATKEQRELLFQKMKDAGYTFDFEKKELKKIKFNVHDCVIKKHNSNINDFGSFVITDISGGKYWYNDRIICNIAEQDEWEIYEPVRQKPAEWSEEDETRFESCIKLLQTSDGYDTINAKWFKSIKNRVQSQPKQEWSEEDEIVLGDALWCCKQAVSIAKDENDMGNVWYAERWLKSLKDRVQPQNIACYNPYKEVVESIAEMCTHYDKASHSGLRDFYDNVKVKCKDAKEYDSLYPQKQWKPSDEQIYALRSVVTELKHSDNKHQETIEDLYQDLKKLMEK